MASRSLESTKVARSMRAVQQHQHTTTTSITAQRLEQRTTAGAATTTIHRSPSSKKRSHIDSSNNDNNTLTVANSSDSQTKGGPTERNNTIAAPTSRNTDAGIPPAALGRIIPLPWHIDSTTCSVINNDDNNKIGGHHNVDASSLNRVCLEAPFVHNELSMELERIQDRQFLRSGLQPVVGQRVELRCPMRLPKYQCIKNAMIQEPQEQDNHQPRDGRSGDPTTMATTNNVARVSSALGRQRRSGTPTTTSATTALTLQPPATTTTSTTSASPITIGTATTPATDDQNDNTHNNPDNEQNVRVVRLSGQVIRILPRPVDRWRPRAYADDAGGSLWLSHHILSHPLLRSALQPWLDLGAVRHEPCLACSGVRTSNSTRLSAQSGETVQDTNRGGTATTGAATDTTTTTTSQHNCHGAIYMDPDVWFNHLPIDFRRRCIEVSDSGGDVLHGQQVIIQARLHFDHDMARSNEDGPWEDEIPLDGRHIYQGTLVANDAKVHVWTMDGTMPWVDRGRQCQPRAWPWSLDNTVPYVRMANAQSGGTERLNGKNTTRITRDGPGGSGETVSECLCVGPFGCHGGGLRRPRRDRGRASSSSGAGDHSAPANDTHTNASAA